MLFEGQLAPDFTIVTDDGQSFRLSDHKGKHVVVYFYPKDNTPGCTIEACDFRESMAQLNQLNCQVIGISRDSIASHQKFKAAFHLNFPLGADESGEVCSAYGVWVEKSMFGKKYFGINRATFLIDTNGYIKKIWPKVSVVKHVKQVLAALSS